MYDWELPKKRKRKEHKNEEVDVPGERHSLRFAVFQSLSYCIHLPQKGADVERKASTHERKLSVPICFAGGKGVVSFLGDDARTSMFFLTEHMKSRKVHPSGATLPVSFVPKSTAPGEAEPVGSLCRTLPETPMSCFLEFVTATKNGFDVVKFVPCSGYLAWGAGVE